MLPNCDSQLGSFVINIINNTYDNVGTVEVTMVRNSCSDYCSPGPGPGPGLG